MEQLYAIQFCYRNGVDKELGWIWRWEFFPGLREAEYALNFRRHDEAYEYRIIRLDINVVKENA